MEKEIALSELYKLSKKQWNNLITSPTLTHIQKTNHAENKVPGLSTEKIMAFGKENHPPPQISKMASECFVLFY